MILAQSAYILPSTDGEEPTYVRQAIETRQTMWRLIKAIFYLVVIGGIALVAYAYIGPLFFPADFAAPAEEVTRSVTLDSN